MAHYAELDQNNIVIRVTVVRNEDCLDENGQDSEAVGIAFLNQHVGEGNWVKTSYNTLGNIHYDPITEQPDNEKPFRGNYAGVGFIYDKDNDVFYPPQPFTSWTLNKSTWLWEAPVAMPTDGKRYKWDENSQSWIVKPQKPNDDKQYRFDLSNWVWVEVTT